MSKSTNTPAVIHAGKRPDCPTWCVEDHAPGEAEKNGYVRHSSAEVKTPLGEFILCSTTGSVDGDDEPAHVMSTHDGGESDWTPGEALRAASDFSLAVSELAARATVTDVR